MDGAEKREDTRIDHEPDCALSWEMVPRLIKGGRWRVRGYWAVDLALVMLPGRTGGPG